MDARQKQRQRVKLASIGARAERRSCELSNEIDEIVNQIAELSKKLESLRHTLSKTKELELTAIEMLNSL